MQVKYTQHYLGKLQDQLAECGYQVRFEKGNFKTGYCILEHKKVVVINKFVPIESKINSLIEILKKVQPDFEVNLPPASEPELPLETTAQPNP